jgi:hypothetical protein
MGIGMIGNNLLPDTFGERNRIVQVVQGDEGED